MSYDLEVRYDASYSRAASLNELRELVASSFPITSVDAHYFVLEDAGARVEIGFTLPEEGGTTYPDVSDPVVAVDLGVPYPYLDASRATLFEIAFLIAGRLNWRVYDPQADQYIDETEAPNRLSRASRLNRTGRPQHSGIQSLNLPLAVAAYALGTTIAAYLVFWRDIFWQSHEETFVLLSAVLGISLIYVAALVVSRLGRGRVQPPLRRTRGDRVSLRPCVPASAVRC